MCTSLVLKTKDSYFGRNMDIAFDFGEIVITPRNYRISFKKESDMVSHYAILGTAAVFDNYPLYADAVNEVGLAMAGLNFPNYACYSTEGKSNKNNITPYEIIPWVLGQCSTVKEARALLEHINIVAIPFNGQLPIATLHWHIADCRQSIVVECTKEGMKVWDNPIGVLANNPTFDFHLTNLSLYTNLTIQNRKTSFQNINEVQLFSKGMGSIGLPGDFSSVSRFVKIAYLKEHSNCKQDEASSVTQFFHLLDQVSVPTGLIETDTPKRYQTVYTSCYNLNKGIYYYKTYENNQINAVYLMRAPLEHTQLLRYPMVHTQQIQALN